MVIKVRDPKRWALYPVGDCIPLYGVGRRPVRLEAHAAKEAKFVAVYPDDTVVLLAAFKGMDTIEFVADGPLEVWVECEGDVYFYTDDGQSVAFVGDGQVSFAKPHERREGSDEIIYIQSLMLANAQRREAKLAAAVAAAEARELERENSGGPVTGELPPDTTQPVVDPAADGGTDSVAGTPTA